MNCIGHCCSTFVNCFLISNIVCLHLNYELCFRNITYTRVNIISTFLIRRRSICILSYTSSIQSRIKSDSKITPSNIFILKSRSGNKVAFFDVREKKDEDCPKNYEKVMFIPIALISLRAKQIQILIKNS